jgi:leishmanolysin
VDADLVVYLTVKQAPCGGGDLGQATACSWDFATGRTLAGVINICPSALEAVLRAAPPPEAGGPAEALGVADVAASAEFGSLVDTIVHEAGHLLGFSTQLYPRFRDAEGRPRPAATLEGPRGQVLLATPRVLEVARLHYGCDEIEGVPMEDGGGEGTRGSHWEVSWIGDRDVMLGTSFRPGRAVMSPLTLALFEDTGWFDVDWDTAGAWGFGAGLGCAVLDPAAKCLDRRYFCDPSGAAGAEDAVQCTWDHMDVGRCYHSEMLPPGCGVVQPFANYLCGEPVDSPQGLWGEARGPNSRCVEVAPEPKVWQARPTRFQTVSAPRGGGAGCYAMECRDGAVSLVLGGRAVPCPAGEFVDLGAVPGLDISRGTLGPCPGPDEVCPGLERADDCNGLGDSVDGECQCYLGFGGTDCSEMLASNDTVQGYSSRASEGGAPGGDYPSFTAGNANPPGGPDWLPQAILGSLIFVALLSLTTAFCTLGERCCDGRRRARREARPRRERSRAAGAPAGFDSAVNVQ